MNKTPEVRHLLQKHGIMRKFHISKTINPKEIDSVYKKLNIDGDSSDTLKDIARRVVESMQAMDYTEYQSIPGVMSDKNKLSNVYSDIGSRKMIELLELANIFSQTMLMEGLTPRESGYVLGLVIKNLNLNDPNLFKGFGNNGGDADESEY